MIDASTLTCQLPPLDSDSDWYNNQLYVQAQFPSTGQTTNRLALGSLFLLPYTPVITSVSSASSTSTSALQVAGCVPRSIVSLTIRGSNLNFSTPAIWAAPDTASVYTTDALRLPYSTWQSIDSNMLTYELPADVFDGQAMQLDVVYEMVVWQWPYGSAVVSNAFYVTFSDAPLVVSSTGGADPSPGSSSSLSGGSVAGIVIGILLTVALFTAMAACIIRRRSAPASTTSNYNRHDDDRMLQSFETE